MEDAVASRPYHHGDLRRALLEAARNLLAEDLELSLRSVARRAAVSHNAPYRHFSGLSALVDEVAAEIMGELADRLRSAAAAAGPATRDRLVALGREYVRFVIDRPAEARLVFATPKAERPDDSPLTAAGIQALGVVVEVVAAGQRSGELCTDSDPEHAALTAWALLHGLATLVAAGQLRPEHPGMRAALTVDHMVAMALDQLVCGLRA
jgi:AcrR family transcriptional regulator